MQRRIREVSALLERSGLPQTRYSVRLVPWPGEWSVGPPAPEPVFPTFFIVEVSGGTKNK